MSIKRLYPDGVVRECSNCGNDHSLNPPWITIEPECAKCGAAIPSGLRQPSLAPAPKPIFTMQGVIVGIILWITVSFMWGNLVGFGSSELVDYCDVKFCR
jgi:uncharacterized protein (DUF983 family)